MGKGIADVRCLLFCFCSIVIKRQGVLLFLSGRCQFAHGFSNGASSLYLPAHKLWRYSQKWSMFWGYLDRPLPATPNVCSTWCAKHKLKIKLQIAVLHFSLCLLHGEDKVKHAIEWQLEILEWPSAALIVFSFLQIWRGWDEIAQSFAFLAKASVHNVLTTKAEP